MRKALASLATVVLLVVLSGSSSRMEAQQPERQPNMSAALNHLREAERSLEAATHDKGGHRVKALKLVKEAIAEVEQGVRYDDTHASGQERPKGK
jgi:predicted transcriptional regulator